MAVRVASWLWEQEAASSNLAIPTTNERVRPGRYQKDGGSFLLATDQGLDGGNNET
jgi:hypothetical protein